MLTRNIKHQICQQCEYPGSLLSGCLLKYFSCFASLGMKLGIVKISLKPACWAKKIKKKIRKEKKKTLRFTLNY